MDKTYSIGALDDFAALAGLFIKFGGDLSEIGENRAIWFILQTRDVFAEGASKGVDTIEPSKDFFRDMAALALKLEKLLIEYAENHGLTPMPVNMAHLGR